MAHGDIGDRWGEELGKLPVLVLPRLNRNPPRVLAQADGAGSAALTQIQDMCWWLLGFLSTAQNSWGLQP